MPKPQDQTACPVCASPQSKVVNVRRYVSADGFAVTSFRHRECQGCGLIYRTRAVEQVVVVSSSVSIVTTYRQPSSS